MSVTFKSIDDIRSCCLLCEESKDGKVFVELSPVGFFKDLLQKIPKNISNDERLKYNVKSKEYNSKKEAINDFNENYEFVPY